MEIIKATTTLHFDAIEQLARKIIPEHYGSFLPMEQVEFFIDTYQTAKAIQQQLQNGFEYYLAKESGQFAGYAGIEKKKEVLVLSKIYTDKHFRGKGIGKGLMELLYHRAISLHLLVIELIVVQQNVQAIAFYSNQGFEIAETLSTKYESGYTVEEFKMSKRLTK